MAELSDWSGCALPTLTQKVGTYICVRSLDLGRDIPALFSSICGPENDGLWRYIPVGPYENADDLASMLRRDEDRPGWLTCVFQAPNAADLLGMASYMRLRPEQGSAEVGCVVFSRDLQHTPAATEAMYLMAAHLFDDLGYRRYEWKCNNDNEGSKSAVLRFGFSFEGVFSNDMVVKGDNRDTAWFSMTDKDWPAIKQAFQAWLEPGNFDGEGQQVRSLASLR